MPRRARDVLLDILRDEGVTHVFGNPGSTEMPLMDALVDVPDIAYVLGLQEATAVGMADGWALASGRAGFVNLHAMGGLGVESQEVVLGQIETADRGFGAEAGMGPMPIVAMEPLWQFRCAFG